jgi:hypothetical protein
VRVKVSHRLNVIPPKLKVTGFPLRDHPLMQDAITQTPVNVVVPDLAKIIHDLVKDYLPMEFGSHLRDTLKAVVALFCNGGIAGGDGARAFTGVVNHGEHGKDSKGDAAGPD